MILNMKNGNGVLLSLIMIPVIRLHIDDFLRWTVLSSGSFEMRRNCDDGIRFCRIALHEAGNIYKKAKRTLKNHVENGGEEIRNDDMIRDNGMDIGFSSNQECSLPRVKAPKGPKQIQAQVLVSCTAKKSVLKKAKEAGGI